MRQKPILKIEKMLLTLALPAILMSGCAPGSQQAVSPPGPAPVRAPATQVVLLPDPDGKVGVLEVSNRGGKQTLRQAWQATESVSMDRAPGEAALLGEEEVRRIFREALEAEPAPPVTFILYFRTNSTDLSEESLVLLNKAMAAIRDRKSTDIIVSGHTDAVAPIEYNRRLSLRRAQAVADALVKKGVDRQDIQITSHGEGNPLVPTPDEVPEPRNRRVEITVR
ncbi:MAG TPA: OmpA family protein [Syntrophales bacterium]|nr:OmpA family protein [Syntrophales bacterium]